MGQANAVGPTPTSMEGSFPSDIVILSLGTYIILVFIVLY